jgi:hypothetical protein
MDVAERGWVGRVLFVAGCALAALLVALVALAPLLDDGGEPAGDWGRVIALFARDGVLRRTSLASAAGLAVSSWVFFRPGRRATAEAMPPPRRPRSSGMAGA